MPLRPAHLSVLALAILGLGCGGAERQRLPPSRTPAGDAGTNPTTPDGPNLRLSVRGYELPWAIEGSAAPQGQSFVLIEADVINAGDDAFGVRWDRFSLETPTAVFPASQLTSILPGRCEGNVDGHARKLCPLYFVVAAGATLEALVLHTDAGDVRATLDPSRGPPNLCPVPAAETNLAACSDGCNNDGDAYVDCDDADCCDVRTDCRPGTHCGGPEVECIPGIEDTILGCKDACDNDGDTYIDCEDFECCDLRVCGPNTGCGQRADPFAQPAFFDDTRVRNADPSTLLAGASPCRAPALVYVSYVPDGDTVRVEPLDGSGVSGLVRIIGVDTPEIGRDGAPSDCFAEQARSFTEQLDGRTVWLTFDHECVDRFDRHLAYVHFGGERTDILQRHLLRRGLARRFGFNGNDSLGELLDNDEQIARDAGLGLWTACP